MKIKKIIIFAGAFILIFLNTHAGKYVFSVQGDKIYLNNKEFKIIGLRCSNALISDHTTQELIDQLDMYRDYGINTISVFFMGSRFGDVKGYLPDGSLNLVYAARMARIIEAADDKGMVVLVGCLYWSVSRAKEDLSGWTQADANLAVANTVKWLKEKNYRNTFVDPDNEGMASVETGWSVEAMIDAAHAIDPTIMVAYNSRSDPPANADLYIHHSPKVKGKPWIETEGSAPDTPTPGGYWGTFTKEAYNATGYYNYSRIGLYTSQMKSAQVAVTIETIKNFNGYMMASTWLQCSPFEGIGGPFTEPGGYSFIENVDADITKLHPDAGIRWWLEVIRNIYGSWLP